MNVLASPPSETTATTATRRDRIRATVTTTFALRLGGITLLALAVRVMNVLWWRPTTDAPGYHGYRLGGDAFYYHFQANALAKGAWWVEPYAFQVLGVERPSAAHPPLYSTYLSIWSRLGFDGVTDHRLASCLLGAAAVLVIGVLAYRLMGPTAGLVAAGIAAIYPELWINDGMLLSESIAVLMTALALLCAYEFWRSPTLGRVALLGGVCGVTALSRNELLALFPLVVIPLALLVKETSWRDRLRLALVACLVGAAVMLPWVVFNLSRFEETTTLTSGGGSALSAASCDGTYYGKYIGYYANCFQGHWPKEGLDESQRDRAPREEALDYIGDHLGRLPVVVGARVGRLWGVFEPGQTTWLDWWLEGRGRAPSWIGLFSYYALLPIAAIGLVSMRRRKIPIFPLLAIAVIATFAAAATFGVTRYRAPAEVALVVAAGIGLTSLPSMIRARRSARATE